MHSMIVFLAERETNVGRQISRPLPAPGRINIDRGPLAAGIVALVFAVGTVSTVSTVSAYRRPGFTTNPYWRFGRCWR